MSILPFSADSRSNHALSLSKSHKPCSHPNRRAAARRRQPVRTLASSKENPITVGVVSLATETLRLSGVGKADYKEILQQAPKYKPLPAGSTNAIVQRIKADFKQKYFLTGLIDVTIYDQNCLFADPTVQFRGLRLWQRNLQLLVPFLIDPELQLLGIKKLGKDETGAQLIKAEWQLTTKLSLPWRPIISLCGATEYTLNEDCNKVVKHIELWSITGTEALLQLFRSG